MDNNSVHLVGTVKRNAEQGSGVLDFAVEVPDRRGRIQIFDCRCTGRSDAFNALEGFVEEGETIEVIGHLEKRTTSDEQRICGVRVSVIQTVTFVYVDEVVTEDEQSGERA